MESQANLPNQPFLSKQVDQAQIINYPMEEIISKIGFFLLSTFS